MYKSHGTRVPADSTLAICFSLRPCPSLRVGRGNELATEEMLRAEIKPLLY